MESGPCHLSMLWCCATETGSGLRHKTSTTKQLCQVVCTGFAEADGRSTDTSYRCRWSASRAS